MLANIWNTILFYPFLNILLLFYGLFGNNLGWAVIVLAILIRLALIPSTKSQTEMTKKLANIKPELDALQKKYGNNKEKLAQEQMKLYKNSGYNPLGCLGSMVPQILILYVMIQVINVVTGNHFDGIYPMVKDFVFGANFTDINTHFYFLDLSKTFNQVTSEFGYTLPALPYLVTALLVGFTQFVSTKFMQLMQNPTPKKNDKKKEGELSPEEMQAQMMNSMNAIFPLMTIFITLTTPAVLGVYWLAQSVMLIAQYFFLDKEKSMNAVKSLFKINLIKNK